MGDDRIVRCITEPHPHLLDLFFGVFRQSPGSKHPEQVEESREVVLSPAGDGSLDVYPIVDDGRHERMRLLLQQEGAHERSGSTTGTELQLATILQKNRLRGTYTLLSSPESVTQSHT